MAILIVDDDPYIANMIAEFLSNLKFNIIIATTKKDFFILLNENETFDLVLADGHFYNMEGKEILSFVKLKKPSIPVILVTGDCMYKKDKFDAAILKPFDPELLINIVHSLLESKP